MKTDERIEILEQAEEKFLEAMRGGWAFGTKGVPVFGMPGYKDIPFEKDGFSILDRYCVAEGGSAGTTTIWYLGKLVWFMSYGGFYRKEDMPFLKNALLDVYVRNEFIGGRGPVYSSATTEKSIGLRYCNLVDKGSTFLRFSGKEFIYYGPSGVKIPSPTEIRGQHDYFGAVLI